MSLEEIRAERLQKLASIRAAGIEPYPADTHYTHHINDVHDTFDTLSASNQAVIVVGRVMSIREHGGSCFFHVFDGTGKMQMYLKKDAIGDEPFAQFSRYVDTGDFVEVAGVPFVTKRGEKSLQVTTWRLISKSILPMPTEWFGIQDEDDRFRKRYLDILLTQDLADRFRKRSKFWNVIRSYLLEKGFVEVETPVLENTTGGADARPFATHHNALDIDVYMRISCGELCRKDSWLRGFLASLRRAAGAAGGST